VKHSLAAVTPLVLLALSSGCVHTVEHELSITKAVREASTPKSGRPKLFMDEWVEWRRMPFLIPFATLGMTHDALTARESLARRAWYRGEKAKADVIRLMVPEELPPNMQTTAVYYRLGPCDPGFQVDRNGMVIDVGTAKEAGLLEGDKAMYLDGVEVELWHGARSFSCYERLWTLRPGDTAVLQWIRPGTGKMEGKITMQANPPRHKDMQDSLQWKPWRGGQ